jgi:hypothetical protein
MPVRRVIPRQHEQLFRGALIGETGKNAVRVIEERGKIHLFDVRGNPICLNQRAMGMVPTTRREAAKRILPLKQILLKKRNPAVPMHAAQAIEALTLFEGLYGGLADAKKLCNGADHLAKVPLKTMVEWAHKIVEVKSTFPELQKAEELITSWIMVPRDRGTMEILRNGHVRGTNLKRVISRGNNLVVYEASSGEKVFVPLSNDAMKRLGRQRQEAIQKIKSAIEAASKENTKLAAEQEKAREELTILMKTTKGKVLTPMQIAELYKFYKQNQS